MLIIEVLRLVARAEIEEMTGVMDGILADYAEDVVPIAVDVVNELVYFLTFTNRFYYDMSKYPFNSR